MISQVPIQVANAAALVGLGFTRIEVWHSGDSGASFQEITAHAVGPAILSSLPAKNTFNMGGHELRFILDGGTEKVVDFAPFNTQWTPAQVADQINTVVAGLASVFGKTVVLTGSTNGRVASILITYNDATDLGWVAGQEVRGVDVRPTLSGGTLYYLYTDLGGDPTDLYKWRFSADGVNPVSAFSSFVNGNSPPLTNNTIYATATFLDLNGLPAQRTIVIVSDSSPDRIGGYVVGSELPLVVTADANGFLAVPLVVGATVRVAIEGTAFVREFVVPGTAGSSFDLLAVMATAPDPFTIQVPPPFLTRRSI